MMNPKTLQQAIIYFSDLDNAFNYFVGRRWPNGAFCPTCGRDDVSFLAKQKKWQCKSSHKRRQFSIKTGSIFEDSPLGLDKWLIAIWMITSCKNGVSSYEVHRAIGVTQKTAWFMVHRIRVAMTLGTFEKLSGTVEADETYMGGHSPNMHAKARKARGIAKHAKAHRTPVIGMVERKGRVKAQVISRAKMSEIMPLVTQYVEKNSTLYTDASHAYDMAYADYVHDTVNHSIEYVRGNVHTNSIENFWSLLKRSIRGTYISVAPFHLQKYVEEQTFRYNERKKTDGERFAKIMTQLADKRLTYAELTGKTQSARFLS